MGTRNEYGVKVRRDFKDSLFRLIFREKEYLLSLYNAVNGTAYTNAEELEIVTLENAIYMNMKNDLAFVLDFYLNIYEHQSTFSPNMPLRDLFYISKELQSQVESDELYRTVPVKIPTPRFIVFYNGTLEQPECRQLRLSDLYEHEVEKPELELVVTMLNINIGKNRKLMEQCQILKDYMLYVERVRKYAKTMELRKAVESAVNECIREGILADFLRKYRSEAIDVSIFEYNEEKALNYIRADEFEEGRKTGLEEGRKTGMKEGLRAFIELGAENGMSREEILLKIKQKFPVSEEEAEEYLKDADC